MNQQDQSSVGLPIKISHQSTGGADLQVACAKEAVPLLSPLHQPPHYHGVIPLSRFRSGEAFSLLSQHCSISYHHVLDGEPHVLLPVLVEIGLCFSMTANSLGYSNTDGSGIKANSAL